ncbi:MAG: response regulator [Acidobacteria bacterium]|nr:response regulator [Acidobacteriota bacterium]
MSIDEFRRDPTALYTLAVEQATDYAIFVLDVDGRVATWAPPVASMLGWHADEFVGLRFADLFAAVEADAGLSEAALAHAAAHGQFRYTRQHRRRNGHAIWGRGRVARLDDAQGLAGFVVSLQDVTAMREEQERHLVEEASLRHRAAELETLLEVVPVGIGIARDACASHMTINRALADMLRMPMGVNASLSAPDGERPHHFRVLRDGVELPADELSLQTAARTGRPVVNAEVDVVFTNGDVVRLLEHASPLFDEHGASRGSVATFLDVTERRHYEQQRERALAAEREARQEAERASAIKDEFLAGLSHEIRTPLNAILGWAQILLHSPSMPEDARAGLEVIERNARLQTRLIEDLLDLSRIASGKLRLDVQPVSLPALIDAAVESVQPGLVNKGLRLVLDVDRGATPVAGDPVRIQQVLWNLLANAVKFTPRDGRITVALDRTASHHQLRVTDTGIGISPEFLPHVFDRFRQADGSTTRSYGGLGVGLAIVKQLVELHGGDVRAISDGEGRGATFVVSLPVLPVRQSDAPYALGPPPPHVETEEEQPLTGIGVLVVEDDDDSRALLAAMLSYSGATVWTAATADAALTLLGHQQPDVIVSDIGLPDRDGYALARAIRALPAPHGGIPAIALTAYARSEDRRLALLAGFQLHLGKPVDRDQLCLAVASLAGTQR